MIDYIKTEWHEGDIIGKNELNKIEVQLDTLSDLMIDENRIGSTLTMVETSSNVPTKLEVKTMSSEAGGITPTPPTTNQDKNILFADGYDKLQVIGEVSSSNDTRNYSLSRSNNEQLTSFSIPAVTTSALGLMSSTDKSRIDSVWNGNINENTIITNNNMITQGENLGFVTDNNFSTKIATIGAPTTSVKGLVPALPTSNAANQYLNGNGQWSIPSNVANLTASGTVTANSFSGNGSNLTGIVTGIKGSNQSGYNTGKVSLSYSDVGAQIAGNYASSSHRHVLTKIDMYYGNLSINSGYDLHNTVSALTACCPIYIVLNLRGADENATDVAVTAVLPFEQVRNDGVWQYGSNYNQIYTANEKGITISREFTSLYIYPNNGYWNIILHDLYIGSNKYGNQSSILTPILVYAVAISTPV